MMAAETRSEPTEGEKPRRGRPKSARSAPTSSRIENAALREARASIARLEAELERSRLERDALVAQLDGYQDIARDSLRWLCGSFRNIATVTPAKVD